MAAIRARYSGPRTPQGEPSRPKQRPVSGKKAARRQQPSLPPSPADTTPDLEVHGDR